MIPNRDQRASTNISRESLAGDSKHRKPAFGGFANQRIIQDLDSKRSWNDTWGGQSADHVLVPPAKPQFVKIRSRFLVASAVVLSLTALAKVASLAHSAKVLAARDPVFPWLSVRDMLLGSLIIESAAVFLLFGPISVQKKLATLLWLCSVFWMYRLGLYLVGFDGFCACLGTASEWAHLPSATVDILARACLFSLTGGALIFLLLGDREMLRAFSSRRRNRPAVTSGPRILSLFLLALTTFCRSHAQTYEIQGTAEYRIYSQVSTQQARTLNFRLSVSDCKWYMRTVFAPYDPADYRDVSSEGSNEIYFVMCLETAVASRKPNNLALRNTSTAALYPGHTLYNPSLLEITPVWFAYASGCYLDACKTNSAIEPPFVWDARGVRYGPPDNRRLKYSIVRQNSAPYLPVRAVFYQPAWVGDMTNALSTTRLATNAIYSVAAFTNILNMTLPCVSRLWLFRDNGATSSSPPKLTAEYQITATNVTDTDQSAA